MESFEDRTPLKAKGRNAALNGEGLVEARENEVILCGGRSS